MISSLLIAPILFLVIIGCFFELVAEGIKCCYLNLADLVDFFEMRGW